MDTLGGGLSIAQLVIDSLLEGDWSGVTGNPVKFGLGNVSLIFDIIFIIQHYVLYGYTDQDQGQDSVEEGPLLPSAER